MRKKIKKKKGFTLIEVVAGLAMFAIVSTIIMNMVISVNKHNAMNKNKFDTYMVSKAFNETIKASRPVSIKDTMPNWDNTDESKGGHPANYFIAFNNIENLTDIVQGTLLKNSNPIISGINYSFNIVLSSQDIESLCNLYGKGYEYGIKIKIQKKVDEKVYLFDTVTMNIKEGVITSTERQFAISSEV